MFDVTVRNREGNKMKKKKKTNKSTEKCFGVRACESVRV